MTTSLFCWKAPVTKQNRFYGPYKKPTFSSPL